MASISAPRSPSPSPYSQMNANPNSHKLHSRTPFNSPNPRFVSSSTHFSPPSRKGLASSPSLLSESRSSDRLFCRSSNRPADSSDSSSPADDSGDIYRWDLQFQQKQLQSMAAKMSDPFLKAAESARKRFHDYFKLSQNSAGNSSEDNVEEEEEVGNWDWDRWRKHFDEIEEQERIVSVLKSQLGDAVRREDYVDAAKLKVAIAAAAANDTVGNAISHLNRAVVKEHYEDAAFIRDHAGAGLMGWWVGISDDPAKPYGRIINISAAYGRFVARSYTSRQLATAMPGVPLFEIYVTVNADGEYKQQAVYLKRHGENVGDFPTMPFKLSDATNLNPSSNSTEGKNDVSASENIEELEDDEDSDDDTDMAEGLTGVLNILRDMIPGAKVKVVKVMAPGKVDRDLISKVFEQIMEEEDEEKDIEVPSVGSVDEVKADSNSDEIDMDVAGGRVSDISEEQSEIAVKLVIGGLVQKLSGDMPTKAPLRVSANIEQRGRSLFSFCINKDENQQEPSLKGSASLEKNVALPVHRRLDRVTSDLAKVLISGEKIPMKVLKDVGEFINHAFTQAQNRKALSRRTNFHRIEIPTTSDPLNGLYIGAHGPYSSEVIQIRRRFGHWKEDTGTQKSSDVDFYEYVEALKLTGDPYVPAGQVSFRAKVGKRYQLPHKGIIPEEFGVVARYKGQGRLAEPGFQNPRWVEGELVILDGKHLKAGPMVGFVYWAPEYHFLVFFSRLMLEG